MKLCMPSLDFTHTPMFKQAVKVAFKKVDKDKSGAIDQHELTLAMAFFYFKIGQKAPGVGEPPSRTELESWFKKHDKNMSGDMDLAEFEDFCRAWVKEKGMGLTGAIVSALAVQALLVPEIVNFIRNRSIGTKFESIPRQVIMVGVVLISKLFFKNVTKNRVEEESA
mmetsp:Transcript_12260/g.33069  ORF Transcript_12260/g.33069 Transcript_12260/m.33069 type:complete len:167 (+) Transcript_12260:51-551(+)